jgi:hexosaminidase
MGVQANLWTEYIPSFSHVEYMIFPRMLALAEVAWTEPQNKDYDFFTKRLFTHLNLLARMNVNYAKSIFDIKAVTTPDPNGNGLLLTLSTFTSGADIRYSVDNPTLDVASKKYSGAIQITQTQNFYAAVFEGTKQISPLYMQAFYVNEATGKNVSLRKLPSKSYNTGGATTLVNGVTGRIPWLGSEWLGFLGDTLDATIDLGSVKPVSKINVDFLDDNGSWIYAPENFDVYYSVDGKEFLPFSLHGEINQDLEGLFHYISIADALPVQCRYLRIIATPKLKIPEGKPGEGHPAWLFVSEIEVK